jgi:nucleoid-associated protein YgaU
MLFRLLVLTCAALALIAGCSSTLPKGRPGVDTESETLHKTGAAETLPEEKLTQQKSVAKAESEELRMVLQAEQEKRIAAEKNGSEHRLNEDKLNSAKQQPLPVAHTVKRGETLPSISGLAEVYNNPGLWPLLYKSNRDQISDPDHISPGQVLRIPRRVSREENSEALRLSLGKPIP